MVGLNSFYERMFVGLRQISLTYLIVAARLLW